MFDFNAEGTAYFVNQQYHMMQCINYLWGPEGDFGKGDSIGRTFEAYYAYGDKRFVDAVKSCWVKVDDGNGKYHYQGYRFPTHDDDDMSRDHVFNTVLILIASGHTKEQIKEFVTHIPFRISKKYMQTVDLWLWMRAVSGIWWAKILSPIVEIPLMFFTALWQKIVYKLGSFNQEMSQDEFEIEKPIYIRTKKDKKYSNLLFPSYTMYQYAWKLHYSPDNFTTKILKRIMLTIANKHNYIIRILLDDKNKPTKEQVYSYKAMLGGRWDGIMNPQINDRDLHIITPQKYTNYNELLKANVLDVDLVRKVYENNL